jgi:hypothetical protein
VSKKRNLLLVVDKVKLTTVCACAASVMLFCGGLFWLLSQSGNGIRSAYGEPITFRSCVHFSVVTFTSLGYGDLYPMGWGRLLADLEVMSGLVFLGLLIAKLASARQNYYLAQLYASDSQKRLREFYADLRRLRVRYEQIAKVGPLTTGPVGALHKDAEVLATRVRNYVAYEVANGDFLGEVPKAPMARILQNYSAMGPLIAKAAMGPDSLHSQKQRGTAIRVLGWMHEVGVLVRGNSDDLSLSSEARRAVEVTERHRQVLQDQFDEIAARFPNAKMARPIEWRLNKGSRASESPK